MRAPASYKLDINIEQTKRWNRRAGRGTVRRGGEVQKSGGRTGQSKATARHTVGRMPVYRRSPQC